MFASCTYLQQQMQVQILSVTELYNPKVPTIAW